MKKLKGKKFFWKKGGESACRQGKIHLFINIEEKPSETCLMRGPPQESAKQRTDCKQGLPKTRKFDKDTWDTWLERTLHLRETRRTQEEAMRHKCVRAEKEENGGEDVIPNNNRTTFNTTMHSALQHPAVWSAIDLTQTSCNGWRRNEARGSATTAALI